MCIYVAYVCVFSHHTVCVDMVVLDLEGKIGGKRKKGYPSGCPSVITPSVSTGWYLILKRRWLFSTYVSLSEEPAFLSSGCHEQSTSNNTNTQTPAQNTHTPHTTHTYTTHTTDINTQCMCGLLGGWEKGCSAARARASRERGCVLCCVCVVCGWYA